MNQEFVQVDTKPARPLTGVTAKGGSSNSHSRPLSSKTLQLRNNNLSQHNLTSHTSKNHGLQPYTYQPPRNRPSTTRLVKIKPNKIQKEKEKLYEDQIMLKQAYNTQLEDNLRLKTKNRHLEQESARYLKLVESLQQATQDPEAHQLAVLQQANIRLRQQVRELKEQLEDKERQHDKLKKNKRVTQVQELEVELSQFQEESYRLTKMLEHVKKQLIQQENEKQGRMLSPCGDGPSIEHKFRQHRKRVSRLKEDNIKLAALVQELEDKQVLDNKRYKDLQREYLRLSKEKGVLKQQYQEQGQLLQNNYFNKNNKEYLAEKEQINRHIESLEQQIDMLQEQHDEIAHQKDDLHNQHMTMMAQSKEQEQNLTDQVQQEQQQACALALQIKREQQRHEQIYDRYLEVLQAVGVEETQLDALLGGDHKEQEVTQQLFAMIQQKIYQNNKTNQKTQIDYEKKRYSKVNSYQIQELAQMVKYNLMLNRVPLQEIELYLFSEEILNKKAATIDDLITQLQKRPFLLAKDDHLVLFCRYLVEDNSEAYVLLDLDRPAELVRILSILKTLLGGYTLNSQSEEQTIYESVSTLITNSKKFIRDYLVNTLMEGRSKAEKQKYSSERASLEELDATFEYIDASLCPKQKEYLSLMMFRHSRSVGVVPIDHLFSYFDGQSYSPTIHYDLQQHALDEQQHFSPTFLAP